MKYSIQQTSARRVVDARRRMWLALLFSAAGCAHPPVPVSEPAPVEQPQSKISSSRELLTEMHDRYAGNWYRTLRFSQANTFYTQSGGEQKSRWVENLSVPGRLRIDFEPLSSKSGLLILNNRVTTFDNGKRIDTRRSMQGILTLTADVYAIPPAVTARRLDSLAIDLAKFREDKLDKKRVYVIGGDKDDLESSQVWIDADKLLLVRLIQREKRGDRSIVTDTHIGQYKEIDGFQVAHEFVSLRDGKPYFKEVYENVRVNEPIPASVFDPRKWSTAQ
ncbi:MAG TPA: hypothetical protein VFC35_02550, partial [Gemmatimonadaceae bacterium]|nr:hypothetical protein [Gemmatimonadaceae bacterium]